MRYERSAWLRFAFRCVWAITLLALSACAATPSSQVARGNDDGSSGRIASILSLTVPPRAVRPLVAIAGFENRSSYASDKLWDTSAQVLSEHLLRMGYFRVVEWERMKRLFDWRELSHLDIVKSPGDLRRAGKILLCKYFISGAVTYFDVSQQSRVSAISKEKIIETSIGVDLLLQDSVTGEYVSSGTGSWTEKQVFSKGRLGTWDPKAADKALSYAVYQALLRLTEKFDRDVARCTVSLPTDSGKGLVDNGGAISSRCRARLSRGKVAVWIAVQNLDEKGRPVSSRNKPGCVAYITGKLIRTGISVVDYGQARGNATVKAKKLLLQGRFKDAVSAVGHIDARFLLAGKILSRAHHISQFATGLRSYDVTIDLRLVDRLTAAVLGAATISDNVTGVDQVSATVDRVRQSFPNLWNEILYQCCSSGGKNSALPIDPMRRLSG